MRKTRVCLVVDNPLRDLDGLVLIGRELVKKDIEVFLVPMYQQAFEVAALMPDLVLLNYSRLSNQKLIKAYSRCGILVGVLDTEGGVYDNVERRLTNLVIQSDPSTVDLYCLWGQRQLDSFIKHNVLPKEKIHVTGCPRYDYCVEPWKSSLPEYVEKDRPMILVNTRFPLVFPKFQRKMEDEIRTKVGLGFEESFVREEVRQCYLVWAEMINVVADLAQTFKNVDFIVRPHPFESTGIYEQVFSSIPNIKIIQKGASLPWINSALLLIQRDCSTAIEACLIGIEAVSLEWIEAPLLHKGLVTAVSRHAQSKEELFSIVENALNGKNNSIKDDVRSHREQVINEWLYAIDGKSSERVAEAILLTINKHQNSHTKSKPGKILRYNGFTKAGIRAFVSFFGIRILGPEKYYKLKGALLRQPAVHSKKFELNDVQVIVDRLGDVKCDATAVTVELVKNKHCRLKMIAQSSIRMAC